MAITKANAEQAVNAAFDYVHPTEASLVKAFSQEFAITNMGQDLVSIIQRLYNPPAPEYLIGTCWQMFYGESESDEMAEGLEDERRMWERDCKKHVLPPLKRSGLPLTMANATAAWEKKGPFSKTK